MTAGNHLFALWPVVEELAWLARCYSLYPCVSTAKYNTNIIFFTH